MEMLQARIEDEHCNSVGDVLEDITAIQAHIPQSTDLRFKCLCYIDPYGIALFNQSQLFELKDEVTLMLSRDIDCQAHKHFSDLLNLIQRAQEFGPHHYLRIYSFD
jgi:hypothetical protein